jgi:arginase
VKELRAHNTHRANSGRRVALIGAPADMGAGNRGAAFGPAALRAAGLARALGRAGHRVTDRGDVQGPGNEGGRTIDGCRHLAEIAGWCRAIRDAVGRSLAAGELPVLLGGDHALAVGSVAAVARYCAAAGKPLALLWLDAHADFNTAESSPSGNVHGMPVAAIAGDGHPRLTGLGHALPMLAVGRIAQIGVRSIDPLEQRRIDARALRVYGMTAVRARGMAAVVVEALDAVARDGAHLHVSFDVDFIDPWAAPGVGTPEQDGPSLDEAAQCMALIRDSGLLGSLDVVELAPQYDPHGVTAGRVVDLVASLLDKRVSTSLRAAA